MSKSGRGIVYLVWGDKIESVLQRSISSAKVVHPELPIEVVRIAADPATQSSLVEKSKIFVYSPFAETLFLDADTVVLDRLDYGFERAAQFGLAVSISEVPWARRYRGLARSGDLLEYNTGVMFFTEAAENLFATWCDVAAEVDAHMVYSHEGKAGFTEFNDQASFAVAVDRAGICPFVLPLNWNFRYGTHTRYGAQKAFFGPLKIWHSYFDVPEAIANLANYYRNPNSVIQYVELT